MNMLLQLARGLLALIIIRGTPMETYDILISDYVRRIALEYSDHEHP